MDRVVELGSIERYVLAHRLARLDIWFDRGFARVPAEQVSRALFAALHYVGHGDVDRIWQTLLATPAPQGAGLWELTEMLDECTHASSELILVMERPVVRGMFLVPSIPRREPAPQPVRTTSDHYVVVEAVDPDGQPVPGVRLELLIAGGEVRSAQTGSDGIARMERIQAARVVIRVVDLDGDAWSALDGAPGVSSGTAGRPRVHVARQGECLSKIAHHYGVSSWQRVWNDPQNAKLKKKRKDPNVLLPGDEVVVPGVDVYELVRPTDSTHKIQIAAGASVTLTMVFKDHDGKPIAGAAYELKYTKRGAEVVESGKLSGAGRFSHELPISATSAELLLPEHALHYQLAIGHLDPAQDDGERPVESGAHARLAALGYLSRPAGDDHLSDPRPAICSFQQRAMGHDDPTGVLDLETCRKLEELYGV